MSRDRELDTRIQVIGSVDDYDGGHWMSTTQQHGRYQRTVDDLGRDRFNLFRSVIQTQSGGIITGRRYFPEPWETEVDRVYNNYPVTGLGFSIPDPDASRGFPEDEVEMIRWALKIVSETNPGVADVSVPQFLGELRELPSLLQNFGSQLFQQRFKWVRNPKDPIPRLARNVKRSYSTFRPFSTSGSFYLWYHWGIEPLLADLAKLLDLQRAIDRRVKEINELSAGKYMKKRVNLTQGEKKYTTRDNLIESSAAYIEADKTEHFTRKAWGSIQWYSPDWSPLRELSDEEIHQKAFYDAIGLNDYGLMAAAWELLPWSWLVDWFVDVGGAINALHNSFDMTWRGLCIMQHTKCSTEYMPRFPSEALHRYREVKCSPIVVSCERKRRTVFPTLPLAFPLFKLPILSEAKLSVIYSLLATYGANRRGAL